MSFIDDSDFIELGLWNDIIQGDPKDIFEFKNIVCEYTFWDDEDCQDFSKDNYPRWEKIKELGSSEDSDDVEASLKSQGFTDKEVKAYLENNKKNNI